MEISLCLKALKEHSPKWRGLQVINPKDPAIFELSKLKNQGCLTNSVVHYQLSFMYSLYTLKI